MVDLGYWFPTAINADGEIIGDGCGVHGYDPYVPCLWKQGKLRALPIPLGARAGQPTAINGRGQVVGSCAAANWAARPCLWEHGHVRDLDLGRVGGDRGRAFDINEPGQVVGRTVFVPGSGRSSAFVWQDGKMTRLPGLHQHDWSAAAAINDHGQIVGQSSRSVIYGPVVLWTFERRG
jgi:probable HAF family extracellular repeat protein